MPEAPAEPRKPRRGKRRLTPELAAKICELIKGGMFPIPAASLCGIPASTFSNWTQRGSREATGIYAALAEAIAIAEAHAEKEMIDLVKTAAVNNVKHAQFFLSRRWPERWSRHDNVTINQGDAPADEAGLESAKARLIDRLTGLIERAEPPAPADGAGSDGSGDGGGSEAES